MDRRVFLRNIAIGMGTMAKIGFNLSPDLSSAAACQ